MLIAEPDFLRRIERKQPHGFLVASVRGVGQVDLQPCIWTGVLILAGLWAAGWRIGLFATIGTLVSTATAHLAGVDRSNIALGLQGYCGCLTGVALVTSLGAHTSTYALAVVGAIMCTVLMGALTVLFKPYGLTALTAPFCLVSGIMVVGASSFSRVWHGAAPAGFSNTGSTSLSWSNLWHAFFTNVSQVFLVDKWYVGLIMLVGLACAGVRVLLWTVAGSVVGILAAWALGAPASSIANGIYGYNAVLVAIAMGAVFLAATVWNGVYTLVAAAVTTSLTAALTAIFKTFGGHTFTWPFILTTWAFMAAVPVLTRFRPAD